MCGIAGIFDMREARAIEPRRLSAMTDALAHRGPDGDGAYLAPGVALGHRRLAIIDIEGGAQPFHTADHRGVLTYNGEIYNFRELSSALQASGLTPRTRSDTEVLAEGLACRGPDFIRQLNGMFAFGYHEPEAQTLLLARDRLGEKPLYYSETSDGFLVFASEIGAILASGLVQPVIDREAVADYFYYGYVPDPKSIYAGIHKLPPGRQLIARRGAPLRIATYWRPDFTAAGAAGAAQRCEELIERLDAAVKRQLVSEAPLGAFLSGGVDSSAIIASMSAAGAHIKASTIGFSHEAFDERPFARRVAERYDVDQYEDVIDIDATALIDRIAGVYGEPFADPSALPTFLVCGAARKRVTVALSGDGGDELFAGYRRYPFFEKEERARAILPASLRQPLFGALGGAWPKLDWAPRPLRLKTTLQALGETSAAAYGRAVAVNLPERVAAIVSPDFARALNDYQPAHYIETAMARDGVRQTPLGRALAADLATWLPGRMLVKVDRAAMAHGLEVRPPLLDHDFADWAFTLPDSEKLSGGEGKSILKRALRPRLPDDILYRRKQGFGLPLRDWMAAPDGPTARLAASRAWRDSGFFRPGAVETMIAAHRAGRIDASQEIWSVVMFDAFLSMGSNAPSTPESRAPHVATDPAMTDG